MASQRTGGRACGAFEDGMTSPWLWEAGLSAIAMGSGLLWFAHARRSCYEAQATTNDSAPPIRAGQLRVLSAEALFLRTGSHPLLDRIAELAGLDRVNWISAGQPL